MVTLNTSYSIHYQLADGAAERRVVVDGQGIARPASYARELGLEIRRRDGEEYTTRRAFICPADDVVVTSISVTLNDLNVLGCDAIYLNGYNSWTDSVERHPLARIRGLRGVPTALINRWVLDGSGDYRFVEQSGLPGNQHGVGYGYLRYGDQVLLVGSLNEDSGFTVVRESARINALKLEKEPPNRTIAAGEKVELVSFAVCEGTLDEAFGRYVQLYGIKRREATSLVGFSSWYRYYDQIDENRLAGDLDAVKKLFAGRDLDAQPVFQIDDGYTVVGDWTSPHADRFPSGLAKMAQRIKGAGFVPGLWMAPFVCSVDSKVYRDHQDWLVRDEGGNPVSTGTHWNGAYALDTLNEEVREHVRHSLWTVTSDWGFGMLKLDFLYGACMIPHGGMNRGELMADALELLRDSVPEGVSFDLCGVPIVSAFGRCEFCRIGCDVGLDWDDVPYMRLLHRERVSTKRSLANTKGRAHLDGVVFRNDPDVFFLRDDVKLTDKQRLSLLEADARHGGVFFTSDDVSTWKEEQLAAFERALKTFMEKETKR